MAYIANKPVRFDRNYKVGEIIPSGMIAPKMVRRLAEMGRILCVDIPEIEAGAGEVPGMQQEDTQQAQEYAERNIQTDGWIPPEEQSEGHAMDSGAAARADALEISSTQQEDTQQVLEYVCPVCGKQFGSKNALSAHSRTHKE